MLLARAASVLALEGLCSVGVWKIAAWCGWHTTGSALLAGWLGTNLVVILRALAKGPAKPG